MILQIESDARPVGNDLDAAGPQVIGIADAGLVEQRRGLQRPRADDYLARIQGDLPPVVAR